MKWPLIFMFKGGVFAAGPYELESCLVSQEYAGPDAMAVCIHVEQPWDRRPAKPTTGALQ